MCSKFARCQTWSPEKEGPDRFTHFEIGEPGKDRSGKESHGRKLVKIYFNFDSKNILLSPLNDCITNIHVEKKTFIFFSILLLSLAFYLKKT